MTTSGWTIVLYVCILVLVSLFVFVSVMYVVRAYSQEKTIDWKDDINKIKEIKLTKDTNGNIITDNYVRFMDSGGLKDSPQPYEGYSRQWIEDGVGKNGETFVYPWTLVFDAGKNHEGWAIKTIECNLGGTQNPKLGLEVSEDGKTWKNANVPWMLKGAIYKKVNNELVQEIEEKRILNNKASPWGSMYYLKSKGGWLFPFWKVTPPVTIIKSRYIRFTWSSYQWMRCVKATGIDYTKGKVIYENPGEFWFSKNECISGRMDGFPDPESNIPEIKAGVYRDPSNSLVGTTSTFAAKPINRTLGWNILLKKL